MADEENENLENEAEEENAEEEVEEDVEEEGDEEGDEDEEGGKKKKKKGKLGAKQKIIFIAVALVILLAVPVALYFTGVIGGASHEEEMSEDGELTEEEIVEEVIEEDPVFYEMTEFLVNLNTGGKQVKFLKMNVMLELPGPSAMEYVEPRLPRIRDSFQIYLRELRAEDLQGSKGIQRLREELLLRINKELYPVKINNILFKDILVQ